MDRILDVVVVARGFHGAGIRFRMRYALMVVGRYLLPVMRIVEYVVMTGVRGRKSVVRGDL